MSPSPSVWDRADTRRIAEDFGVDNNTVSNVPTLSQGGYGCGILFISTLGDLVRRRPLVLLLMSATTALSIGLALSKTVHTLEGLSFLVGMLTVSPPLARDAPQLSAPPGHASNLYTMDSRSRPFES